MKSIVLYCRPGFEQACAQEIVNDAASLGLNGEATAENETGYVIFTASNVSQIAKNLSFDELIFTRQWLHDAELVSDLNVKDRLTPLIDHCRKAGKFSSLVVEYPDTNQGKQLSSFCRKFSEIFEAKANEVGMLQKDNKSLPQLHLFFVNPTNCYVGYSWKTNASPYFMGIPRLKSPAGAPSRSTLKLSEAFACFLNNEQKQSRLKAGMHAVDLGAAPGGWTLQLVNRGIHVKAIDNGPMSKEVLATEMVEHIKTDGFRYKPRRPVNWMVCDMVEKPARVTNLIVQWLSEGYCNDIIFNLKLPMKKRYEAVMDAKEFITNELQKKSISFELQLKQLYHDREEITGYLSRGDKRTKTR